MKSGYKCSMTHYSLLIRNIRLSNRVIHYGLSVLLDSQPVLKRRLTSQTKIAPANSSKVLLISQPIQVKTNKQPQIQEIQQTNQQRGQGIVVKQQPNGQQQIIYIGSDGRMINNDSFQTIQLQNGQQGK